MFGYIAAYVGGIVTGATLIWLNRRTVQIALDRQRRRMSADLQRTMQENAQLRQELDAMARSTECADAYRRGKNDGRHDPATSAERFAKSWEGRNVQFRNRTA
jgi:hypothetical protein